MPHAAQATVRATTSIKGLRATINANQRCCCHFCGNKMKFLYLLALLLPILEAPFGTAHSRYVRQAGRYATPGAYRPNPSYASGNVVGVGLVNSYGSSNGNVGGNVRLAYVPGGSGAIAGRPYSGVGGFKYGGRPSPGSDFVVNAAGGAVAPGGVGSAGAFSANHPQAVYKNVGGAGGGGSSFGRPQAGNVYRVGPSGALTSGGGRPLSSGSHVYQSG
ncbi:unnamed protein product [Ceratitis capitata]|uniref:(Mediterranean fruit fly) hypothetical protein n=1 Tax=Ceratitis capitata TaxID=7213 RepID=A0A811VAF7_CERCA|nr:unnamed protein product [Ceratitis capitata]